MNKQAPHPICIYLVAHYLSQGKPTNISAFNTFIVNNGISKSQGSAQAIWSVGTTDGKYLGLFDKELNIIDPIFFKHGFRFLQQKKKKQRREVLLKPNNKN